MNPPDRDGPRRQLARDLLRDLTEAAGAPGHEDAVREIVHGRLREVGGCRCDRSGSIVCELGGGSPDGPVVMVAGHMDEVGFMVQNITLDGFIQFVPLGGWWTHTLLAQRVRVVTSSGKEIPGLITSIPVHFLSQENRDRVLPIESLFIDVGAKSRADAEDQLGIKLGDSIVPDSPFTALADPDLVVGKAFDNRAGMAVAVHAALEIAGESLPCRVSVAGTVQEEVGCRGAVTAAQLIKPDAAIILEGPPADDGPGFSRSDAQGALGEGVQIRLMDPSAIMNRRFTAFVRKVAEEEDIPHQITVRRSGGTDAKSVHLSGIGVPCVVLGVPARYIHSHASIIHMHDYFAALDLVAALVRRLDRAHCAELVRFLND